MAEYGELTDAFLAAGAQIAALSVDEPVRTEAVRAEWNLRFPILCDTRREVVRAWGVFNAGEKGGIAFPAVFVLAAGRKVRARFLETTASRLRPKELLAFLCAEEEKQALPRPHAVFPRPGIWAKAMRSLVRFGVRSPRG